MKQKIGASLRVMGFEKKRVRVSGKLKTVWARIAQGRKEDNQRQQESAIEVRQGSRAFLIQLKGE